MRDLALLFLIGGFMVVLWAFASIVFRAFHDRPKWGWACLLVPYAVFVYAGRTWANSKTDLKIMGAGFAIHVIGRFAEFFTRVTT